MEKPEIDQVTLNRAYAFWAPVYDKVFGKVFAQGRRASIDAAERLGGRILDVGVGTGIALPDYKPQNRIYAVDYSEPMLKKARQRVVEQKLAHVECVSAMDAQNLGFKDASFDVVIAQYVITAVPDPEKCLDELARVLRPGGEIILVNHIGAERGPRKIFELGFAPMAKRLGWRPEFRWARIANWVAKHGGVQVIERVPMPPMGHFSLIRIGRLVGK